MLRWDLGRKEGIEGKKWQENWWRENKGGEKRGKRKGGKNSKVLIRRGTGGRCRKLVFEQTTWGGRDRQGGTFRLPWGMLDVSSRS